ncbi:MAG TPA: serine hydrolase domain-containing protein [Streptosporangiaceae bacterium]
MPDRLAQPDLAHDGQRPAWLTDDDLAALAAIARTHHRGGSAPGLAYGIIAGPALVHSAGFGSARTGGPVPDGATVFRIASMTKSFTAAAVLALRDDGILALDDPAERYVPELRGLRPATSDSPPVTVRNLLTMTAGLPTDDPWGDRQQGMPPDEFSRFLAEGIRFAWAPGTQFEYANLGYAILGRVITAASGSGYTDVVRDRLLRPLGMDSTGFAAAEFDPDRLAAGYRRAGDGWQELIPDGDGAFAPMGGIFSTVADLTRWVAGFAAAFPPGGPADGGAHPLRRSSRREMQLPQVALPVHQPPLPAAAAHGSYGFGLFVEEDGGHGRIVQHGGGYPGYGSHMRWHPASGLGVIVLANSTYAPAQALGARMLDALLRRRPRGAAGQGPALAPERPWPETLAGQRAATSLLQHWDDEAASRLCTANVALDEPYPERRARAEQVRRRIGEFADDTSRPAEHDSAAHCRWWLRGERGTVQAEIRLTPHQRPMIQQLVHAVPPAHGSVLSRLTGQLIALLNDGAPSWPPALPAAAGLDTGAFIRRLRVAAAWAGPCTPGAYSAGDGDATVTVELEGQRARLLLTVTVDERRGELREAGITLAG